MEGFLAKYPAFKGRDVYITGESYAGHYIPMFANHLFYNPVPGLTISGIALGNAWVDPFYQYQANPVFALQNNIIDYGHYYMELALYSVCQMSLIIEIPLVSTFICEFSGVSIASPLPSFNVYDIREPCVTFGLCYPDDKLDQVLNSEDYRSQFFPGHEVQGDWEVCADLPHLTLMSDFNKSWGYKLAPLLDAGIPVLVYNGDKDYICNAVGAEMWTDALVWEGQGAFRNAQYGVWKVDGVISGLVKNVFNLTVMQVFDAGHMVPMD
jgi:carboxypeptidase C (cathepsin A)